ncbi:hypothetical protein E7T06_12280 [Deinococcus sp. Arct2-2]|jgi:hypothetical protein|uniref:hypothetical protein n=1 Tax=Deinococcus sp. Arct2-2 TaxID=2568653 RepID=UPI0010A47DA0|nr:hypothetical protein [Deinococcus sp. Arct2-2]THF69362.1 hypothetical protein E7T06_12280 [Deinococcus sp. Arct2-2]
MTRPSSGPPPPGKARIKIPTEALLNAARSAAQKLADLSRDPQVREEATNVARAIAKLLQAVKNAPHNRGEQKKG